MNNADQQPTTVHSAIPEVPIPNAAITPIESIPQCNVGTIATSSNAVASAQGQGHNLQRLDAADQAAVGSEGEAPDERPDRSLAPVVATASYELDAATPLNPRDFPSQPRNQGQSVPTTIANVLYLLKSHGISVRYNVIKKKLIVRMPGHSGSADNYDNIALTTILSLASLNGLSTGQIPALIEAAGDRALYNPVADWIFSKQWDGVDRLPDLYATLVEREDFPKDLKKLLIHHWLLSAVAAALSPRDFRCRGVLTLQGPQSIGKTAWFNALVSDPALREALIKIDHHLDPGNKDSILVAIEHWIVEIGELDSSFRKDIARLKGFLTAGQDKVRRPYGRLASEYPRRTVFCASVNERSFLVDPTGNTRWWTIPVVSISYQHGIDMQQVFAQLAEEYHDGATWWLSAEEEQTLELQNNDHRAISALRERVLDAVMLDQAQDSRVEAMTPTEVLRAIGIDRPSNPQCKECGSILRDLFGEPKRINGRDKWRVPLRSLMQPLRPSNKSDDDIY